MNTIGQFRVDKFETIHIGKVSSVTDACNEVLKLLKFKLMTFICKRVTKLTIACHIQDGKLNHIKVVSVDLDNIGESIPIEPSVASQSFCNAFQPKIERVLVKKLVDGYHGNVMFVWESINQLTSKSSDVKISEEQTYKVTYFKS